MPDPEIANEAWLGGGIPNFELLPPLFSQIAQRVQAFLTALGRKRNNLYDGIATLDSLFSEREAREIDYELLATPFTYNYFLENFWKASCTFLHEIKHASSPARHVVDVGCGSGATVFAYLACLDSFLAGCSWRIDVVFVDRSQKHLGLAKRLLETIQGEFEHLNIVAHYECAEFESWSPRFGSTADILLFGHVLNENRDQIPALLEKAIACTSGNGRVIIIERIDDLVWGKINRYVPQLALEKMEQQVAVSSQQIHIDPRLVNLESAHRLSGKQQLVTKYLALRVPEHKSYVSLLRMYFEAWEKQSEDMLARVFARDAEYFEKPFRPPLKGLSEIQEYWRENVLAQKHITIRLVRVAYTNAEAFAEWSADFVRCGTFSSVKGALILRFDEAGQRVQTLHEYFRKSNCK